MVIFIHHIIFKLQRNALEINFNIREWVAEFDTRDVETRLNNVQSSEAIMDEAKTNPELKMTWAMKNDLKNFIADKLKKEWNKFIEGYVKYKR